MRAQRLDVFLVLDAEALLLVDDHQTEVLVEDTRLQQAMRADHDVDLAARELPHDLVGIALVREPREPLDRHRERAHALVEGVQVLLRQYGCRHQHGYLLA